MKRFPALLAIILFSALVFRLVGVGFGYPLVVHPDEHNLVYHAMEAGANRGNPGWFEYPSGMIYATLLIEGARYLLTGAGSASEFWGRYASDPFPFHLWVRIFVALTGVLGVFAVWLLGREWDRGRESMRFLSWGAAVLLAVNFLHVRDSHFATVDIPLTTAITFALWLLLREFHRESTNIRRMLGVAFFVGICCGIKYTAAPLVFPLLYIAYRNATRGENPAITPAWLIGSASLLLVMVGIGFFLTTPYALLDAKSFWRDVGFQWFAMRTREPVFGGGYTFLLGYLEGPWMWSGGKLLAGFAFFGLMMALLRNHPEDKVLLWFAVPYYLLISIPSQVWGRWFLPLVVLQVLWTTRFVAVYADHEWAVALFAPKVRRTVAVGVVLLIAGESLIADLRLLVLLNAEDSRAMAARGIDEYTDPETVVLVTAPPYYCPPVPKEIPRLNEDRLLQGPESLALPKADALDLPSLDEWLDQGVGQVLYSSFYWDAVKQPFLKDAYPSSDSYINFLGDLELEGERLFEVHPAPGNPPFHPENIYAPTFDLWMRERPGPEVRLYSVAK
jgi:hypothetical protein